MANAAPSRSGQINVAGDPLALFLKVFSGETLAAFARESAFRNRHTVRTIASGKSAQFPVFGRATARYHVPGTEITGASIGGNERLINIEDILVSDVFIADIDDAMQHYDVSSIYSGEMGQILANTYDRNVARAGILNARGTAAVTGLPDGYQLTNASYATDGTVLYQGVYSAGVQLDTNDVPMSNRTGFFRPVQHALLVQSEKPINFDLNQGANPNGSIAQGRIEYINGIGIVKTNNLPNADDRLNLDIPAIRRADYSPTVGLIQHNSAVGTVQLQDITMASQYDLRRLGTLMVGKYLVGHGGLRPEAGVEMRTAAPSA
jgi:hypothetical protein